MPNGDQGPIPLPQQIQNMSDELEALRKQTRVDQHVIQELYKRLQNLQGVLATKVISLADQQETEDAAEGDVPDHE